MVTLVGHLDYVNTDPICENYLLTIERAVHDWIQGALSYIGPEICVYEQLFTRVYTIYAIPLRRLHTLPCQSALVFPRLSNTLSLFKLFAYLFFSYANVLRSDWRLKACPPDDASLFPKDTHGRALSIKFDDDWDNHDDLIHDDHDCKS